MFPCTPPPTFTLYHERKAIGSLSVSTIPFIIDVEILEREEVRRLRITWNSNDDIKMHPSSIMPGGGGQRGNEKPKK